MSEPKVILPWFPFWEMHVLTAQSPCSVCSHSSAPAPCSPQPILAPLDSSRELSPADGHGGCRRIAGGIRHSCFILCYLGQIPTLCQFLCASNCCSLWGTDVASSVAPVQPPDTTAEENSAHYMELEFRLNRRHRFFSHLTIAGTVNRNVGMWHQALCCSVHPSTSWLETKILLLKLVRKTTPCLCFDRQDGWALSHRACFHHAAVLWVISGPAKAFGKWY